MAHAVQLPLRERKKLDTRRRIFDVASHLFVDLGVQDTTIEAIAQAANVSRPTFFNYFSSKQEVLRELMTRMDEEFVSYILHAVSTGGSTEKRLRLLMAQSGEHIQRWPEMTKLLLIEGMSDLGCPTVETSRMSILNDAMATLVKRGRQEGDIDTKFSIELQVQILVGGYLYGLLNWLSGDLKELDETLQETALFLAEALAPR